MLFKKSFLEKAESKKLAQRITEFETNTGCELVIHVRKTLGEKPLETAEFLFHKFNLHKTKHHAAIFVVVSYKDRSYAVWVDKNVLLKLDNNIWRQAGNILQEKLSQNQRLDAFLQLINYIQPPLEKIQPKENKNLEKSLTNEIIEEEK